MTKEEIEKEADKWLRKYLLCYNCEKKCNCIESNSYCEQQVLKAYVDSAEPREKRIAELEKENAETQQEYFGKVRTDNTKTLYNALNKISELEKENEELKKDNIEWEKASDKWKCVYELTDNQLTKAKEIIRGFMSWGKGLFPTWQEVVSKAEVFLSEVENDSKNEDNIG